MNASKQIKLGSMLSYISVAVNILSGLIYTPWMVATIGKSQYGLYTLANSVITLFLVDFGLSSATGRYLSKYNAEGNRESAEVFLGAIYKLYLLMDAVILCVLTVVYFGIDRIFANLTPLELEQFKVVYGICAIFSVVNFPFVTFNGILTAYEKFVPLKLADICYRLCNVAFTVLALLLGFGLYALVGVHVAAGLLVLVIKFAVIRKTVPLKVKFRKTEGRIYREIFGFSAWIMMSMVASRLVFSATPSILGIVSGSAAIAVFGIVSTMEGYTYSVITAISGMFMPRISRIMAQEGTEKALPSLFINVGKFQYILNGAIITVFAVIGRDFIRLWMDESYLSAYWGLLLVLVPGLFYNAMEIANTTLVVTGQVKLTAVISLVTGVVNVCLSFPLSRLFGEVGACLSICLAYFVRAVLSSVIYHRVLPLDVPGFMKECCLKMSVPILISVCGGIVINIFLPGSGWGMLLIKATATALIYLLSVVCFGLTGTEIRKALEWIKK